MKSCPIPQKTLHKRNIYTHHRMTQLEIVLKHTKKLDEKITYPDDRRHHPD